MKKKFTAAALALTLLFSACAPAAEPAPTPTPTPAPEPAQTPEPTPDVSAESFTVHTDFSLYEPYEPLEPVYTRLRDGHIPDLEPSDDYGMLYPFVGAVMYTSSEDAWNYQGGGMYGLFDETGRIVADPTYVSVEQLSWYDSHSWKVNYAPLLLLTRSVDYGPIDEPYAERDVREVHAVASLDGSFVTDCVYGWVQAFDFGVLCAESYDSRQFTIYDFEGNVLATERDIDIGGRYPSAVSGGGEGTLLLYGDKGYSYCGLDGSILSGPWRHAEPFSGGRAVVVGAEGGWGVIDRAGRFIVEPDCERITQCQNGSFLCEQEGDFRVLDADGEYIFSPFHIEGSVYVEETAYGWSSSSLEGSGFTAYGYDGTVLYSIEDGEGWNLYGTGLVCRELPEGTELIDVATGKTVLIEGGSGAEIFYEGDYIMGYPNQNAEYVLVRSQDTGGGWFVSLDLGTVKRLDADAAVGAPVSVTDHLTGETYYCVYRGAAGARWEVYDGELCLLGSFASQPGVYNGCLMVTGEQYFTCTAINGGVLFRYPLIMSGGD